MPMYVKPVKLMMHYNPLDPFHWIIVKKNHRYCRDCKSFNQKFFHLIKAWKWNLKFTKFMTAWTCISKHKILLYLEFHYIETNLMFISDINACFLFSPCFFSSVGKILWHCHRDDRNRVMMLDMMWKIIQFFPSNFKSINRKIFHHT